MKKTYKTPSMIVAHVDQTQMICESVNMSSTPITDPSVIRSNIRDFENDIDIFDDNLKFDFE